MPTKFYNVDDVMELLGVSKPYAYRLIRRLNAELAEKGRITMAGKVSSDYLDRRFFDDGQPPKREEGTDVDQ